MANKTKHDKFTVEVLGQIDKSSTATKAKATKAEAPTPVRRKPGRPRKSTTLTPAKKKFIEVYARTDNATEAVRQAFPDNKYSLHGAQVKGSRLLSNDVIKRELAIQQNRMDMLASKAVDKIDNALESDDEDLAFKAGKYVYDQTHGQATKKIEKTVRTVEVKLDLTGVRIGAHYLNTSLTKQPIDGVVVDKSTT